MPKVVTQQRRGRGSNPRLLDRKSDALALSHRANQPTNQPINHEYLLDCAFLCNGCQGRVARCVAANCNITSHQMPDLARDNFQLPLNIKPTHILTDCISQSSSSSRMRFMSHNWSATKQRLHPQSVAEISRHSVLSRDRIRQCETSSGTRHKDTDQCL